MSTGMQTYNADGSVGFDVDVRTLFWDSVYSQLSSSSLTIDMSALASRYPTPYIGANATTALNILPWGYTTHNVTISGGVITLTPQTFTTLGAYSPSNVTNRIDVFLLG